MTSSNGLPGNVSRISAAFIQGATTAALDQVGANVCYWITNATGGWIDLNNFANNLSAQATNAFNNAATAQTTANTAVAGISTVATGVSANVTGTASSTNPNSVGPAVQLLNATIQAVGSAPQIDIFNVNGTWAAPSGVMHVDLTLVAAGGGGAQGGWGATGAAGGGGGAGGYSTFSGIAATSLPSSCAVTVPVGGRGGQNTVTSWRDDFNRANSTNLGSNWRTDSGTSSAQILNNAAECGPMGGSSGENGRWMTWIGGSLLTDNYLVQAQLLTPANAEATNNFTGIYVAAPSTYGSGTTVVAFVGDTGSGGACGIITQVNAPSSPYIANGGQTGQTVRANSTTVFTNSSLIALSRVGNVFTGYINGTAVVSWTDSSNVVLTGSGNRGWGFITEGNYPTFQQQYDSPAIDWIQARDLGIHSQPGTAGGNAQFYSSSYQVTGGGGGVGGGTDGGGTTRPATGSWLNTSTSWNGAQGTGNQASVNPAGGIGAAGQTGFSPSGAAGGNGLNTSGGAAGTATSLNGSPGAGPTGGVYGPASGGGGGYYLPTGNTGTAGAGAIGGFPGGGGGGGGATLDGQGANGWGAAGGDGQVVVTARFT